MDPIKDAIHQACQEDFAVPPHTHQRIEEILDSLPEKNPISFRPRILSKVLSSAAVLAFLFFVLLPNLSPAYAQVMEKVPVLGSIVKIVTIRNYLYDEGQYDMDLRVPEVQHEIAEPINRDAKELAQILLREFYENLDLSGKAGYGTIHMDYAVVTDTDTWFTLKLMVTQVSASSNSYFRYYHIDKQTGKIIGLGDLFKDESYGEILRAEVKEQMQRQMEADPSLVFWIGSKKGEKDLVKIEKDHNFYWNSQGELVLAFDKYEVGPGATGCPEFTIPVSVTNPLLKPQYQELQK